MTMAFGTSVELSKLRGALSLILFKFKRLTLILFVYLPPKQQQQQQQQTHKRKKARKAMSTSIEPHENDGRCSCFTVFAENYILIPLLFSNR